MKKIIYAIILTMCANMLFAQNRVEGLIVSAADQLPVAGATIKIEGNALTLKSDENGTFALSLPSGKAILEINSVGFNTKLIEVLVPLQGKLKIQLEVSENLLQEVTVSTGYQEIPKERSTGSFTKIDEKLFSQQVGPTVISRLEAVANGLSVDRRTNTAGISIRGLSTIQGISTPLIVVDNFPYEGNLDNINPNEVGSISILKDAAATSIWGTKAGNGVIVITTKKSRFNQPLSIELNSNLTLIGKPDLSHVNRISSAEYIELEKMLYFKGYYASLINSASKPALSPVIELLISRENASVDEAASIDTQIESLKNKDVLNDFKDYVYSTSVNQQYSLSLRAGSDKVRWGISTGYDNNISNLDGKYDRLNLAYKLSYKPVKRLELSSELYFTKSAAQSPRPGYGDMSYGRYPYTALAVENGKPLAIPKGIRSSYLNSISDGKLLDWKYYPLTDYLNDRTKTGIQDVLINTAAKYSMTDWLSTEIKYQYQNQQTDISTVHSLESYFTRDLVNRFTQISSTGSVTYKIPNGGIYDFSAAELNAYNLRGQLSVNKKWKKHSLVAIAGAELREARISGNSNRYYGIDENTLKGGKVDYTSPYPNIITGSTEYIPYIDGLSENVTRYVSLFSNAAYTYLDKYTLSLSGRRDASNLFGVSTNDKWTPLWSSGAAWDISKEGFYHLDWLPFLKLRATYGFSGNVDQSRSALTTISFLGSSVYTQMPFAMIARDANPDLRWERVSMQNIGLDFSSRNQRISGSVEYYEKKGTDLFGPSVLDYTTGISSISKNVAAMRGRGLDIQLNSINLQGKLKWVTTLNLNTYHDRVTQYYLSSLQGSNFIGTSSLIGISGLTGKPVHGIFSYRWGGLDPATGDPRGFVAGQVSKDYTKLTGASTQLSDLVYHGSALPTTFGSIGNSFTFKDLTLDIRLMYKLGYFFFRPSIAYSTLYSSGIGLNEYSSRWQKPGDEALTNVPGAIYPSNSARDAFYNGAEVNVLKGDHLRLQYITLSYDLKSKGLVKLNIKKINLYASANNLGIIWRANKEHIDPEYPIGTVLLSPSYSIGLRAIL
ncbi:SusC/RagA family TonB-linked outer membrane protein [Pedobacter psychrodurus]|uniref:SusC/RagA family TonB-linked outer membrane protein n=1 Tax=Pedobacter psychrodurus TaxID=2530456 RepID=UPI00292E171F|nr:SusC/RagA family TonB-linked outer membrane protein [Pedobacter psychrodurus]